MSSKKLHNLPICPCGSRDFETLSRGRNHLGRYEFKLACSRCGQPLKVSKTTWALFNYLNQRTPSQEFLRIYDMGS